MTTLSLFKLSDTAMFPPFSPIMVRPNRPLRQPLSTPGVPPSTPPIATPCSAPVRPVLCAVDNRMYLIFSFDYWLKSGFHRSINVLTIFRGFLLRCESPFSRSSSDEHWKNCGNALSLKSFGFVRIYLYSYDNFSFQMPECVKPTLYCNYCGQQGIMTTKIGNSYILFK